jgi:hypothetical protein
MIGAVKAGSRPCIDERHRQALSRQPSPCNWSIWQLVDPAIGRDGFRMTTAAPIAVNPNARVIPGRECGSCSLCCKVYNIPEIGHIAGKWCKHCKPGKGCVIHDTLPSPCAAFNCMWRTEGALPPHWKPDQARMVVTIHPSNGYIYVQVDPGTSSAWRKQPYYDQLRQWAQKNLAKGIYVIVFVNDIATLIMPNQDLLLGPMKPTDSISLRSNVVQGALTYEATLIPAETATLLQPR